MTFKPFGALTEGRLRALTAPPSGGALMIAHIVPISWAPLPGHQSRREWPLWAAGAG